MRPHNILHQFKFLVTGKYSPLIMEQKPNAPYHMRRRGNRRRQIELLYWVIASEAATAPCGSRVLLLHQRNSALKVGVCRLKNSRAGADYSG
jgi:hypothetical protein